MVQPSWPTKLIITEIDKKSRHSDCFSGSIVVARNTVYIMVYSLTPGARQLGLNPNFASRLTFLACEYNINPVVLEEDDWWGLAVPGKKCLLNSIWFFFPLEAIFWKSGPYILTLTQSPAIPFSSSHSPVNGSFKQNQSPVHGHLLICYATWSYTSLNVVDLSSFFF